MDTEPVELKHSYDYLAPDGSEIYLWPTAPKETFVSASCQQAQNQDRSHTRRLKNYGTSWTEKARSGGKDLIKAELFQ